MGEIASSPRTFAGRWLDSASVALRKCVVYLAHPMLQYHQLWIIVVIYPFPNVHVLCGTNVIGCFFLRCDFPSSWRPLGLPILSSVFPHLAPGGSHSDLVYNMTSTFNETYFTTTRTPAARQNMREYARIQHATQFTHSIVCFARACRSHR